MIGRKIIMNIDIEDVIEQLQVYTELEGTEVGDTAGRLIELYESSMDYISPKFLECLERELRDFLENFQQNYEIVEEDYTPPPSYKRKTLNYKG